MTLYPHSAGFTEEETSREAATKINNSGWAVALREEVLHWFQAGNTGTAHELAAALGRPNVATQPRISELRALGLVDATGERRKNDSGMTAHVWALIKPVEREWDLNDL